MTNPDEAFERAVEHESRLRRRAEAYDSATGAMRMTVQIYGALAVAWAFVLAAHWLFFADPRWLVLLHSLVFCGAVGFWAFSLATWAWMRRQRPDLFGG